MGVQIKSAIAVSLLVGLAVLLLARGGPFYSIPVSAGVAIAFAVLAFLLRGVDLGGTCAGSVVAFIFLATGGLRLFGLLLVAFVITLGATWAGRMQRSGQRTAESTTGRSALQVAANLLVATIILAFAADADHGRAFALVLAVLAELIADTVSSEIGEAYGGAPMSMITLRRVAPGTNGALSLTGTLAGAVGAAILIGSGAGIGAINTRESAAVFLAAMAGMFVDSALGATLEMRGLLNNDAVNLLSTLAAAVVCALLLR
ncbi:MAG: DUF92 domain-containing protein [Acidobacteriales bacterium]|nr:DUF92 domain-containing protein [Terriglobales bacterium]